MAIPRRRTRSLAIGAIGLLVLVAACAPYPPGGRTDPAIVQSERLPAAIAYSVSA